MPTLAVCDRDEFTVRQDFSPAAKKKIFARSSAQTDDGKTARVARSSLKTVSANNDLCQLLTQSHLRSIKGETKVRWSELPEFPKASLPLTATKKAR